ncbi:MAG TPA: hypothetical protein VFQ43_10860 [Nitrososphaera sp.]|nr:hypothetical protein [Nitrososphaera sp.]
MSKSISKRDKIVKNNLSGWDKAMQMPKRALHVLKAALTHALAMKEVGEPWPGDSATRN